jgi:hypothetical protein
MSIRDELRYCAEHINEPLSGMATAIILFGFCSVKENPPDMTRLEESIFLLLCAESL